MLCCLALSAEVADDLCVQNEGHADRGNELVADVEELDCAYSPESFENIE